MTYPKQLLRLQPRRGFISDTPAHEVTDDFYTECSNVVFRDGFATRLPGNRLAYESEVNAIVPDQFFHAINSIFGGLNWWLLFQADGTAHAVQAGSALQIDAGLLSVVARPEEYSSTLLNGLPVISNGRVEPVYWDGSTDLRVLPGWVAGESCSFIAALKFHLFALNISGPSGEFETLVKWSAATAPGDVPQEWVPSLENDAGDVILADSPGEILCAYPLGDALYVYKRTATYQIRYVGGQNVFAIRKVQSASGALTRRSVVDIGGGHFIVSDGDIILNDGTTRKSLGAGRVNNFLFDLLDETESAQLSCSFNRARGEVTIAFPSTGSTFCDVALIYDMNTDSFGFRTLDQVTHVPIGLVRDTTPENTWINRTEFWVVATEVWASDLGTGAIDSLLTLTEKEFTLEDFNSGSLLDTLVGRTGLTFGNPERVKFVKRVHIRTAEAFGTLFIRVGGSFLPNAGITWSAEVEISGTTQVVNIFAQGRYIAVEVRSVDGVIWQLTGIDIEAEIRGYF